MTARTFFLKKIPLYFPQPHEKTRNRIMPSFATFFFAEIYTYLCVIFRESDDGTFENGGCVGSSGRPGSPSGIRRRTSSQGSAVKRVSVRPRTASFGASKEPGAWLGGFQSRLL